MGESLGAILPLALGVAISPVPIIAVILMLLSPKAKGTSVGFLAGWIVGIVVAIAVFILLAAIIPPADPDAPRPIAGTVRLLLGVLLLLLALRQWRGRPKSGEQPKLPAWMNAIERMNAGRAFVVGFALVAVNPKNLLLAASAGVEIGNAGLDVGEILVVALVFVLIAAITVLGPVVAYLVASDRLAAPLESLRMWLVHNNATIMTVLLLVLGVAVIGKGIAAF